MPAPASAYCGDQGDLQSEVLTGFLAAAVRHGILSPWQARLIGRNRLEGVPLARIAAEQHISHTALCNRRKRAEKAITDAIRNGFTADCEPA